MLQFTIVSEDADAKRDARFIEQSFLTEGQNLGPVPVDVFLNELLPLVFSLSDAAFKALIRIAAGVPIAKGWENVPKSGGEKEVVLRDVRVVHGLLY